MLRKTLAVLFIISLAVSYAAATTITVTPALSPNGYGSPSYAGWVTNAISALENGQSSAGTPGTPQYYQAAGNSVSAKDIQVTSFNSWMGTADPGTAFGPAYANELGNRLLFGVSILGDGSQIEIADLSFTMSSTDPDNALGYTYNTGSYNYSNDYVGVLYGNDGHLGGGDDTYITSGLNTQAVDAIFGRGSGNAYWPCGPGDDSPCGTIAEQQAAILASADYPGTSYDFTGVYTLNATTGAATVTINPTPEPASIALIGFGIAAIGLKRFRKRT